MDYFLKSVLEFMGFIVFYLILSLLIVKVGNKSTRRKYSSRSYSNGSLGDYSSNSYLTTDFDFTNNSSSTTYNAVQDMLDYPSDDGPIYNPYENQLYD